MTGCLMIVAFTVSSSAGDVLADDVLAGDVLAEVVLAGYDEAGDE